MKGNTYKYHLILLILRTGDSNQIFIENLLMKNSLCEKCFAVKFDYQLTFDQHAKILCKKANAKLKVFTRAVWYTGKKSKKEIKNGFPFCCTIQLLPADMNDPQPFQ